MDPYRPPPNQYGFRPPPPPAAGAPPFGAPRFQPRPPFQTPVIQNTKPDNDKMTTLFVGAIAAGISDEWIEKLLETCGKLTNWKRVKDQSGKPKGFGFATYEDPDSVLCALRVLSGEKTEGVVLKATDGSGVEKKLIVKADDNVRNYLENYEKSRAAVQGEAEKDMQIYDTIQKHMASITAGLDPTDTLNRDLAAFKERAAQRDLRHDYSPERKHRRGSGPRRDFKETKEMTDEEMEKKRREKHDRDVENAYRQREKRFEMRESSRVREHEKDLKRERDEEENEARDRVYWAERLANWDDQVEMEKGEEIYYIDRSRWRKMREAITRRENERDEEDRRREVYEVEQEKRRAEEEEKQKKESRVLTRETDLGKIALKPTKLNFNLPIKRNANLGGGDDDDDDEDGNKKRRVLIPLDYSDIEMQQTEELPEISAEERAKRVKALIDSIPSSQQDLWSYQVKWDELDEELVESKLHPFVSKKIVEVVGMEEDDLVNFILDFIRKHKGPDALVTELEVTLDEEALVFVMKLWRALIFETERKAAKL
ncbi:hypothetical protein K501DRAFT_252596 [Backusella circina FSU 941]|nr:hypothetical protein K501DRAFT_252596 [Backusella circina FSU 941]